MKTFIHISFLIPLVLTACSGRELDKSATTTSKALHVPLKREYRLHNIYSCEGQFQYQEWRTVNHPVADVEIHPKELKNFWHADYVNEENGSQPCVSDKTNFRLDLTPGFCNMRVKKGINKISYRFYYCYDVNEDVDPKACRHTLKLEESGALYVNITYQETHNSQPLDVYDCK